MIVMKKILLFLFAVCFHSLTHSQDIFIKDYTKPAATEIWEPQPKIVTPGLNNAPPSDAIVLFNGKDTDSWIMSKDSSKCKWKQENNVLTAIVRSGNIKTKQLFGDCQLHLEFMIPADVNTTPVATNRGNSGIFLQERYEVQIFDSYKNETPLYANGITGSIYKQVIPLANAGSKPGDWNNYDIYYTAPKFRFNGTVETPAFVTVVHNNVLVLNHFEIQGSSEYIGTPHYELHDKGAIELQEHGSGVSFRNVWIREL